MANYCYNDITICANGENLVDLEFLHSNLAYLLESNRKCNEVFNTLLESYEKEEVPFDGRDSVEWFLDEIDHNINYIYTVSLLVLRAHGPQLSPKLKI